MTTNTPNLEALPEFVRGHRLATLGGTDANGDYLEGDALLTGEDLEAAQVVTSWTGEREAPKVAGRTDWDALAYQPETFHRPVLDLDFPAAVIPSSTPGHGHLYLDKVLTWSQYVKLMEVMAEVGILEPGYVSASIAREFTSVRLPWVKKPAITEPEDYDGPCSQSEPDSKHLCGKPIGHPGEHRCNTSRCYHTWGAPTTEQEN